MSSNEAKRNGKAANAAHPFNGQRLEGYTAVLMRNDHFEWLRAIKYRSGDPIIDVKYLATALVELVRELEPAAVERELVARGRLVMKGHLTELIDHPIRQPG
jgi:hypothetical protein